MEAEKAFNAENLDVAVKKSNEVINFCNPYVRILEDYPMEDAKIQGLFETHKELSGYEYAYAVYNWFVD